METKECKAHFYSENEENKGEFSADPGEGLLRDPFFRKRFHTICHFASGGMGVISKARDLALDRLVAVKSLKDAYKKDPEQRAAFLRECRFHARLDHPSIVPIYAMGISDRGALSLAMKFIHGENLKEYILKEREKCRKLKENCGRRPLLQRRLEFFLRICEAVAYCHSMQLVHGDLKPENILLGSFGELYVMDWGCARSKGSSPRHAAGTLNYLPPEFLREKIVTPGLDIFALGMILFELSSLRRARNTPPSAARGLLSIYDRKSFFFYPGTHPLPARLKAIISKAVDPDPAQRYQKVEELIQDVRGFLFNGEVKACRESCFHLALRFLQNHPVFSLTGTFLLIFLLACGWLLTLLYHTYKEEKAQEEFIKQTKMIASIHLLSLPVTRELLRAKAKLLLLADNALMSRYSGGNGQETLLLPLPAPSLFRQICRKVEQHEIYSSSRRKGKMRVPFPLYPPVSAIKSMGVYWENGILYRDDDAIFPEKYFSITSFPGISGIPGWIYWGKVLFQPEKREHFFFCHTPLYGKKGEYLGLAFLELDLKKILLPLLSYQELYPEHKFYFIPCCGKILQVEKKQLALLAEEGEHPLASGKVIREILKGKRDQEKRFIKTFPGGKSYYAVSAELPVADASLLLLIAENAIHGKNDNPLKWEKLFSFQIF